MSSTASPIRETTMFCRDSALLSVLTQLLHQGALSREYHFASLGARIVDFENRHEHQIAFLQATVARLVRQISTLTRRAQILNLQPDRETLSNFTISFCGVRCHSSVSRCLRCFSVLYQSISFQAHSISSTLSICCSCVTISSSGNPISTAKYNRNCWSSWLSHYWESVHSAFKSMKTSLCQTREVGKDWDMP
jgi:hypothetical protein